MESWNKCECININFNQSQFSFVDVGTASSYGMLLISEEEVDDLYIFHATYDISYFIVLLG
jgi:hypothetical protein